MEIISSDILLVIQGKIQGECLRMLDLYKDIFDISIVTMKGNEYTNIIETDNKYNGIKMQIIKPIDKSMYYNRSNIFYQAITTYYASKDTLCKYIIKIRGDEYFSNLQLFIQLFNEHPDKILTSDIFFKKQSIVSYHCSDHIIAGKREYIVNGFKLSLSACKNRLVKLNKIVKTISKFEPHHIRLYPEQIITMCLLLAKKVNIINTNPKINKKIMIENFFIIDSSLLGDFILKHNHVNKIYNNDTSYFKPIHDINNIIDY
jgi:hypothetical protein